MLFILVNITIFWLVYRFLAHQKHVWSALFYYYYWNSGVVFLMLMLLFESEGIFRFIRVWWWFWILGTVHLIFFYFAFHGMKTLKLWFKVFVRWWYWDSAFYLQYEYSQIRYSKYLKTHPLLPSYSFEKNWLRQQTNPRYLSGLKFWWFFWLSFSLTCYWAMWKLNNFVDGYQWSFFGIVLYGFTAPQWYPTLYYVYWAWFFYFWIVWYMNNIHLHVRDMYWPHGTVFVCRVQNLPGRLWLSADKIGLYNFRFKDFFHPATHRLYEPSPTWVNWHQLITDADLQYWASSGLEKFYRRLRYFIAYGRFDGLRVCLIEAFSTDFIVFRPVPYF